MHLPLPDHTNQTAQKVVDAAFAIHKALGPGLLENVYGVCLAVELAKRELRFETQVALPVVYDGARLKAGFRLDFLVENAVVLELKAVEVLLPLHRAQLLTYLKLSGHRLGLLINFNVRLIRDGIQRLIL